MRIWLVVFAVLVGCGASSPKSAAPPSTYLDSTGRDDAFTGGSRFIPIKTAAGTFNVWVKRVGNNPRIKVLLLHGGPGATHEYMEAFDSYFPGAGIEYYYYDQLGSAFSDQPDDGSLWELPRFVEEVEQVRTALKLDPSSGNSRLCARNAKSCPHGSEAKAPGSETSKAKRLVELNQAPKGPRTLHFDQLVCLHPACGILPSRGYIRLLPESGPQDR